MRSFTRNTRKTLVFVVFSGLVLMNMILTPSAFADSPVVTGTLIAGILSENSVLTSAFTASPGSTGTYTLTISISNLTGNTSGWNLTIASTAFMTLDTLHSLPNSASTMTALTASCTTPGTCSSNTLTNSISPLPAVPVSASAVKFFSISSGGTGIYTVTPTISVAIPATATLGSYTSTITLAVVSGP